MKAKLLLLVFLTPFIFYAQTQIGDDINGKTANDQSGKSVSLSSDGNIIAIGAPKNDGNGTDSGHVRVYENISGVWTQIGIDINGESAYDNSGQSVSLSADGSMVAIGSPNNDGIGNNSGHVRVYKNNSGNWTQLGTDIDGEAAADSAGSSVSLSADGSIIAIGAPSYVANDSYLSRVRVYEYNGSSWIKIGLDIDGEAAGDNSGQSVSLSADGSIVAIGAPNNDGIGNKSGHVRVYKNNSGNWTQLGTDIDGEEASDQSGQNVSLSANGSIVAITAQFNDGDNGTDSGHVRVYEYSGSEWTQLGADIDGENSWDYSGSSVSLSSTGDIIAIGAPYNDGSYSESGHVRMYKYLSDTWNQTGNDLNGEAASDFSGANISLSPDGSTVAIGAYANDGGGTDSGHVRVYDLLPLISIPQTTSVVTGLNEPIGLVLNGNDLYISEYEGLKISKTDITLDIPNTATDVVTGLSGPWFTLLHGNILYIADYWGDKVSKIDITEANPTITDVITLSGPAGLALKGNDLFISEYTGEKILKIDITDVNPIATEVVTTGLSGPTGIIFNGDILYIADWLGNKLSKIDITDTNPIVTDVLTGLSKPEGLTIKGNDLYISEYTGNKIIKIDVTEAMPTKIDVVTGVPGPTGIMFIGNDLYIAERDGNKISKITISTLGINNYSITNVINLYPNPVSDILNISLKNDTILQNVKLYNILGQQVLQSEKATINVSNLKTGIYFVEVTTNNGRGVKKVLVE